MKISQKTYTKYTPYTYHLCWSKFDIHYYGSRTKSGCTPEDLFNPYKSSSKFVKDFIQRLGNPDIIEVRKLFNTREETLLYESKVLKRLKVYFNPKWLNICSNGIPMPNIKGLVQVRDSLNKCRLVSVNDPDYLNGNLIHASVGKVSVRLDDGSTKGMCIKEFIDGNYKGVNRGKSVYINKEGKGLILSPSDILVTSGEYFRPNKGKQKCIDETGKVISISTQERLSRGLQTTSKGMSPVFDKIGNKLYVSKNDPRIKSGELTLVILAKGKLTVRNEVTGKIIKCNIIPEGYVGLNKGGYKNLITCEDRMRESYRVFKNDSRIGITLFPRQKYCTDQS